MYDGDEWAECVFLFALLLFSISQVVERVSFSFLKSCQLHIYYHTYIDANTLMVYPSILIKYFTNKSTIYFQGSKIRQFKKPPKQTSKQQNTFPCFDPFYFQFQTKVWYSMFEGVFMPGAQ